MLAKKIGQNELELLQFIANRGKVTVREASDTFGAEKGYVRTTLLQMMERLRKKGFLDRAQGENGYLYFSTEPKEALQKSLVQRFVEGTLSGSVSPFVAYLNSRGSVSEEELDELKKLVDKLDAEKREGK